MRLQNLIAEFPVRRERVPNPTQFGSSPQSPLPRTYPALHATNAIVGANDDAPRKWYQVRNPLWVIVMAMAFQFSVMALIVALG
jgi:hypothetical protein